MKILIFAISIVLGSVFLGAEPAFAWGPSAHLFIGNQVLAQVSLLGSGLEALLSTYPLDFLYGSIFADMSLGKKFFLFARMAHNWRVGMMLRDNAKTDHNLACAYGYLAHLAADTVAHNEYVPFKLVQHYKLLGRGHIFFEGRFDAMIPDRSVHKFSKEVIKAGSGNNDQFLESSLTRTLFSFKTNRRIYNGILTLHQREEIQFYRRYQAISHNHVTASDVNKYIDRSLISVMDFLENSRSAECYAYDPHGKKAIKQAEALRGMLRSGHGSPPLLKDALKQVAIGVHRR